MTIREEIQEIVVPNYEDEIVKPMAGKNHARIQSRLIAELLRYEDKYDVLPELDLELPGRARPDLCIYPNLSYDWWKEEHKVTQAPIIAIEILSYSQGIEDLLTKARDIYFTANVQSAWFVVPGLNIIYIATPNGQTAAFQQNERLIDPVTGIEVELKNVFK